MNFHQVSASYIQSEVIAWPHLTSQSKDVKETTHIKILRIIPYQFSDWMDRRKFVRPRKCHFCRDSNTRTTTRRKESSNSRPRLINYLKENLLVSLGRERIFFPFFCGLRSTIYLIFHHFHFSLYFVWYKKK